MGGGLQIDRQIDRQIDIKIDEYFNEKKIYIRCSYMKTVGNTIYLNGLSVLQL